MATRAAGNPERARVVRASMPTMLSPAQRVRVRRAVRASAGAAEADVPQGELNITPFLDVVVNLVLFLLATTAAVLTTSELEARLPAYGPGGREGLHLSVTLTAAGAIVSSRDGTLAPDCEAPGPRGSVAVPASAAGGLDAAALERCAAHLHGTSPTDRDVILAADPLVPYADVVAAMDALRGRAEAPYFDDVLLSAGVR